MTQSELSRKLKMKPGARALLLQAPDGYAAELAPLPEGATVAGKGKGPFDWIQVFARNSAELKELAFQAAPLLAPHSILWLSFPKGTSKAQTDLTRDTGWGVIAALELKYVTLVAVDATWSSYALRPYKPGEERAAVNPIAERSLQGR
jgi:hypothetical protein